MKSETSSSKTRILKLLPDEQGAEVELNFELDFLTSLTVQQRFELMFARSREMAEMLRANGHTETPAILKRP